MLGDTQRRLIEDCPQCGVPLDVTEEQPLARVICPACETEVTVRRRFNQFVIREKLGEGGMSRVYLAEDLSLGREVALKILNRRYSSDEERVAQFEKEARITALVNHPNVVRIYSVGRAQGLFFIAMELVSGGSMEDWIRNEREISDEELMRCATGVAKGLRAAHIAGLVHRDIKPGNILLSREGVPKIVDFGLSLVFKSDVDTSGEIWGTPFYVPPEKLDRRPDSFRGDIYSLGATLFHVLVGRPAHDAQTSSIDALRKIKAQPVDLKADFPWVKDETAAVIGKMMRIDPAERYDDYDDLVEALRLAYTKLENPDEVVGIRGDTPTDGDPEEADDPMARRLFWLGGTMTFLALAMGLFVVLKDTGREVVRVEIPRDAETDVKAVQAVESRSPADSTEERQPQPSADEEPVERTAANRSEQMAAEESALREQEESIASPLPELDTDEAQGPGVGDRFLEAREQMLGGEVEVAEKAFAEIYATGEAPVFTRCWAALNRGLCFLLQGQVEQSRDCFRELRRLGATESDTESEGLDAFFLLLSESMLEERVPDPVIKSDFDRSSSEALGLLALGMKAWQMGAWETAMIFFDAFEVTERTGDHGWVESYRSLLPAFREDYPLVAGEKFLRRDLDEQEVTLIGVELERQAGALETVGRAPAALASRIAWLDGYKAYREELQRSESEVAELRRIVTIKQAEIGGLQRIVADIDRDDYVTGYRFSEAAELLERGAASFESPAIREAVAQHLYLWNTAEAFMEQVVADLNTIANERSDSDSISPVDDAVVASDEKFVVELATLGLVGEVLGADRQFLRLGLEFGESRKAVEDLPAEGLAELATRIADQVADSNEHYRRRELIAVFAHLVMPDSAADFLQPLMRENRAFRQRWGQAVMSTDR